MMTPALEDKLLLDKTPISFIAIYPAIPTTDSLLHSYVAGYVAGLSVHIGKESCVSLSLCIVRVHRLESAE